jgi:predicted kinase
VFLAGDRAYKLKKPLVLPFLDYGTPASGKSHLSAALAAVSGLAHISSDVTRKRLAGLDPTDAAPADRYAEEFSRATYAGLGRRAAVEVGPHGGAIVDGTFRRRADRDAFAQTLGSAAPVVFVQCDAPTHVLVRRAIGRQHRERHGSDATLAVVLREHSRWEALDEVRGDAHLIIRADRPVAEVVGWLDARLWRTAAA